MRQSAILWGGCLALVMACSMAAAVMSPAGAGLVAAGDLASARANARAGGPLSAQDKEMLDRWGCLSGTKNPYCYRRERGAWDNYDRQYRRHQKKSRNYDRRGHKKSRHHRRHH